MEPKNKKEQDQNERQICRAKIEVVENSDFDFEAVAVPVDNRKLMFSKSNNEYFYQVLRTTPDSINTTRLDNGLPIFDNHPEDRSARNILGITVDYEFNEKGLIVRGKFGSRADEALRNDVKNGIIKTVSIEGDVMDYEIKRQKGKIPDYEASSWMPDSLSFAPVPNDIGAQIGVKRALSEQIEKSNTPEPPQSDSFINQLIKKF